jgi:protein phosphatase
MLSVVEVQSALAFDSHGRTNQDAALGGDGHNLAVAELRGPTWIQRTCAPHAQVYYGHETGQLFVVADRLPALSSLPRELAARRLTLAALDWLLDMGDEGPKKLLKAALLRIDPSLCRQSEEHSDILGAGAALTIALCCGSEMFVAHRGDGRCYLMRGGRILTRLTDDDGATLRLGSSLRPKAEVHHLTLQLGDRLLLCTNGLPRALQTHEIALLLSKAASARAAVGSLLTHATLAGTMGNVALIVAEAQGPPGLLLPTN